MRHYLVVANQTLGGEHLLEKARACMQDGPCRFHILVPATPPRAQLTWTEGEAEAIARERLDREQERFRELGAEVDGTVGAADPITAVRDTLQEIQVDEIILSTLPAGPSRWLRQDLPHRVERFGLPVSHVIMKTEARPA